MGKPLLLAGQADQRQNLGHPGDAFAAGQVGDAEADVASHVQVREQGVILKHHADLAGFGGQRQTGAADHLAGQLDLALGHRLQPGHGSQQGGLAAT